MKKQLYSTVPEIIAYIVLLLFLYTGFSKLLDETLLREQIAETPILAWIAPAIAITLPWIEIATSIALAFPRWRLNGLRASFFLLVLFTVYVGAILLFDKNPTCSCGGIIGLLSWKQHLLLNATLVLLVALAIYVEKVNRKEQKELLTKNLRTYAA